MELTAGNVTDGEQGIKPGTKDSAMENLFRGTTKNSAEIAMRFYLNQWTRDLIEALDFHLLHALGRSERLRTSKGAQWRQNRHRHRHLLIGVSMTALPVPKHNYRNNSLQTEAPAEFC